MPQIAPIIGAALATFGPLGSAIGSLSLFTSFLIRAGIGLALSALSRNTAQQAKTQATDFGFQVTARGSNLLHPYIYGEAKVYGAEVYRESTGTDNNFFHQVLVFAGHEVDSFVEYWVDDYLVTLDSAGDVTSATKTDGSTTTKYNGNIRIRPHLGTTTQAADSELVNASAHWTNSCTLYGLAYLYVRFTFGTDVYPNGIPQISAKIRGKKVYDPRDSGQSESSPSTWLWSDNPALCLRDYLVGSHGVGEDPAYIDNNLVIAAADDCDVLVSGSKKFTCNGSFLSGVKPIDQIPAMLSSMAGLSWYGQGKDRMHAGVWKPPVLDLGDDDLRSALEVSPRHSARDLFNSISGLFRGAETDWQQTEYPPVTNSAFVTEDGGETISTSVDLPFTTDSVRARRIARILLEGHRQQIMVEGSFGLRAVEVQVGENVRLTNSRFGWTNKEFQVVAWALNIVGGEGEAPDIQVRMTLRETASSVYDEVADGVVYTRDNTTLPSAFYVPPVGIALSASLKVVSEKVTTVISADVTATGTGQVRAAEVEYKQTTDSTWISVGTAPLGRFEIVDATGASYDVRARGVNIFGVRGSWTTYTNFSPSLASTPNDVTGFTAVVAGGSINLFWDAATDLDLSYYEIRHALEESGATWSNATTAVGKIARPATTIAVPARPGTYMIRAVSKTGAASTNYTSAVVPVADLQSFTTNLTQTESPTFPGTKTNCSVTSGELRIDSPGTVNFSADYAFSAYIDTGAVRRVRARCEINVNRNDLGAGLFDSLSGYIDAQPGLWDSLNSGTGKSDTDVVTYISTTNDDPAGTPTWSAYRAFQAGDFSGRAFRFKAKLITTATDVSPAISGLTARIEY